MEINCANRKPQKQDHDGLYLRESMQTHKYNSQLTQCTKYNCHCLHQNKEHAPTVKMVHNNYNTTLCKRSKTHSKTSTKTIGANFRLGCVVLVAAALIVITFPYYSLVLNKARHADDGYKRMDLEKHRLLIDPVSK